MWEINLTVCSYHVTCTFKCGFTLKCVHDMIIKHSQMHCTGSTHKTAQLFGQFG